MKVVTCLKQKRCARKETAYAASAHTHFACYYLPQSVLVAQQPLLVVPTAPGAEAAGFMVALQPDLVALQPVSVLTAPGAAGVMVALQSADLVAQHSDLFVPTAPGAVVVVLQPARKATRVRAVSVAMVFMVSS